MKKIIIILVLLGFSLIGSGFGFMLVFGTGIETDIYKCERKSVFKDHVNSREKYLIQCDLDEEYVIEMGGNKIQNESYKMVYSFDSQLNYQLFLKTLSLDEEIEEGMQQTTLDADNLTVTISSSSSFFSEYDKMNFKDYSEYLEKLNEMQFECQKVKAKSNS